MKLATFKTAQGASYGAVTDKGIVDLGRRLGSRFPDLKALIRDNGIEEAKKHLSQPPDFKVSEITCACVIADGAATTISAHGVAAATGLVAPSSSAPSSARLTRRITVNILTTGIMFHFVITRPEGTRQRRISRSRSSRDPSLRLRMTRSWCPLKV